MSLEFGKTIKTMNQLNSFFCVNSRNQLTVWLILQTSNFSDSLDLAIYIRQLTILNDLQSEYICFDMNIISLR